MCLLMACGDNLRVGTQTHGYEDVHTDRHKQRWPKMANVGGMDEDSNGTDDHMEMFFTLWGQATVTGEFPSWREGIAELLCFLWW